MKYSTLLYSTCHGDFLSTTFHVTILFLLMTPHPIHADKATHVMHSSKNAVLSWTIGNKFFDEEENINHDNPSGVDMTRVLL